MMMRVAAVGFGTALLVSAGAAMASADEEYGDGEVDVTVDIAEIEEPGVLALSVAGSSAVLTENGSTDLTRQFTGTLPTVTVTDTRSGEDIPEDAAWYVLGTASDFAGDADQPVIPAANLGWKPALLGDDGDGIVFAGEPVEGAVDGGPGLADRELLVSTFSSTGIPTETAWTANAELVLRTATNVAPGSYSSTLTLSLFE